MSDNVGSGISFELLTGLIVDPQ